MSDSNKLNLFLQMLVKLTEENKAVKQVDKNKEELMQEVRLLCREPQYSKFLDELEKLIKDIRNRP